MFGLPVGSCIAGLVAVVTFSLHLKHPCAIFSNILNIASCFYCKLFSYTAYLEFEDILKYSVLAIIFCPLIQHCFTLG